MKAQGEFDKVVVASGSDFGRTLTSNGEGRELHSLNSLRCACTDLGRGRLLPRYPLENMYVPVAEWMGLNSTDLMTPFRTGTHNS
eukprot:1880245-Amphidinium_carterae.1